MAHAEQRRRVILTLRNGDTIPVADVQRQVLESLEGTAFEIVRQPRTSPSSHYP
jgi:hypothetical protein